MYYTEIKMYYVLINPMLRIYCLLVLGWLGTAATSAKGVIEGQRQILDQPPEGESAIGQGGGQNGTGAAWRQGTEWQKQQQEVK